MEIVWWAGRDLPEPVRRQVEALTEAAWPGEGAGPRGHDPALRPVTLVLQDRGRALAALSILSKPLVHRGESYAASGLSAVVTAPEWRRQGLGRRLIVAARREMQEAGADLAIFTCDRPLVPFYTSGGYEVLPGTVLVGGVPEDPLPSDRFDKATLWSAFTDWARRHAADFAGARVELYPGTIDRLW